MKERPILFNGEMVRAILAGAKTQTRRLVKPDPSGDWSPVVGMYAPTLVDKRMGEQYPGPEVFGASDDAFAVKCPYGQPGDRLWVRETWKPHYDAPALMTCIKYRADGALMKPSRWSANEGWWVEPRENEPQWYPSIFMRRSFSRLTLEITGVRCERLQDITEGDARAEGVTAGGVVKHVEHRPERLLSTAREQYAALCGKINGVESWASNPWVWVVEFKRVEGGAA